MIPFIFGGIASMIILNIKQLYATAIVSKSGEKERGKEDGERRQEGIVKIEVNSYLCERY